jgi:hypothetical protein
LSISSSGSAWSRWLSAATEAENASPWASAEGTDASGAVVVTTSLPLYATGAGAANAHATAWYVPPARLVATTVSVLVPPSLDPTVAPSGSITVRISSLVASSHVIVNVNVASTFA